MTAADFHRQFTSENYATGDTAWSQLRLHHAGQCVENLDDISQCIRVILGTPYGSDALRPTFGSELWKYLDYPAERVSPYLIRETCDAIRRWEPRCVPDDVQVTVSAHEATLLLHWHPAGTQTPVQTPVSLPRFRSERHGGRHG